MRKDLVISCVDQNLIDNLEETRDIFNLSVHHTFGIRVKRPHGLGDSLYAANVRIGSLEDMLDLRKLQAYPIPLRQLFAIEVLLRITASIEMFMVLLGAAAGIVLNPKLPDWGALAIAPYILFNLAFAVGMREVRNDTSQR